MYIVDNLNELAELQAELVMADAEKRRKIDEQYTEEIRQAIEDIEDEWRPKMEFLNSRVSELTEQIKNDVSDLGETVKGKYLMAVYAKGRVTWDTKTLDGLMIAIPELASARKEGSPSVSIRKV